MARNIVKREQHKSAALPKSSQHWQDDLVSSGDTIAIDLDVTMTDEPVDEGLQAGNGTSESANFPSQHRTQQETVPSPSSSRSMTPLSGEGLQLLGRGVKKLVQAVQNLRHLGVENLILPLPKIVVVGDQSTGKSSLIEGMSEIKVPRNTGTCTRCPLEINLTENTDKDAQWSCTISLVKRYVYDTSLARKAGATRARPLGPWIAQDYPEVLYFAEITSKEEAVGALERAQLATLNPSSTYEKYKPGNPMLRKDFQVKFSPNLIRLDITGAGLPNLSFYDLPGVINVAENEGEAYLVDLVRNLVKDYIRADDCINILALSMTDDLQNSSAFSLVKEVKAVARTMGCLTKPDRMQQEESMEQWAEILEGQRLQLGFGYHVIKNNPDPNIDHTTARKEEAVFFRNEKPWNSALAEFSDHFGTLQLQGALSQRLTAQIQESLPHIIEQIQQKAQLIEADLKQLPEALGGDLPAIVFGKIHKFDEEIGMHVNGTSRNNAFRKTWQKHALEFRNALADSRPTLFMRDPQLVGRHCESPAHEAVMTPTPTRPPKQNLAVVAVDSDSEDGCKPSPATQSGRKRPYPSIETTPNKVSRSQGPYRPTSKRFSLAEVRDIIQDAYVGIPGIVDHQATETMIRQSMKQWPRYVGCFLNQVKALCEDMVSQAVIKWFHSHQQTLFYDQILDICERFFQEGLEKQHAVAKQLLDWEQHQPITLNLEAWHAATTKALNHLESTRRHHRAKEFVIEQEARSGKTLTDQAREEKIYKITDAHLGPEMYKVEIKTISSVKAYYECAYSRFVDTLCASIQFELFAKCHGTILQMMKDKFRATDSDARERLAVLMAADPKVEERRAQLMKEKETLQKAQEQLDGIS